MAFLETPRLLFRAHQASDEEHFIQMQMDPEVRRYVGGRPWLREEALQRFRGQYLGKPLDTSGLCATVLKSEDRYIGYCGLRYDSFEPKSAHIGYYLARPYWGCGLATEATSAFINLAFSILGLNELLADADSRHEASEHILSKSGFVFFRAEHLPSGRIINHFHLRKTPHGSL
jgi:ribosomal-protein-alanine N-acetyltransferase